MKKIIAALAFATLLFGCGFGSDPAEPTPDDAKKIQSVETILDDNLFVVLSAEILCLPSNHPEAAAEEIEILAKNILENAGVSEETFNIYQLTIEADAASKKELSLAILGKMGEFCTIVESGEEEIAEEDSENLETDCAKEGEMFSKVFTDEYPEKCCSGLTEWASGMDTRKVENGECVETGMVAGSPVGTCLNCGNGVCEEIENICNCPEDCSQEVCRDENYTCTPEDIPCCAGLKEVGSCGEQSDNGLCVCATCGSICRPCGNGICDTNENRCNCPEDCS